MSKKKTHAEYVAELAVKNPDIEVVGIYMGNKVKIPHRCKIHEIIWDAAPNNTLNGCGCSECKKEKIHKDVVYLLTDTIVDQVKYNCKLTDEQIFYLRRTLDDTLKGYDLEVVDSVLKEYNFSLSSIFS